MSLHPTITAALADQHRRDLMSQASACRQARAARQSRPRNPVRRPLIVRALGAAVASAIAAAAFLATPAGPANAAASHVVRFGEYQGHGNWYGSVNWGQVKGSGQHGVLAVHFANGKWCMNNQTVTHHYQATTRWA